MTLFRRINDILTANLHDLVDRFEDPEKMLRHAMRDIDEAIGAATNAAARSIAGQKLLGKELDSQRTQAARWQDKAQAAVAAGDDDQARGALLRRREHERLAAALQDQHAVAQQVALRLRRRIERMKLKRADAARMLLELTARQCIARAYQHPGAHACGNASSAVFQRFEKFRQRVERAEAEAEALDELAGDEDGDWASERNREQAAVEMELLELKQGQR